MEKVSGCRLARVLGITEGFVRKLTVQGVIARGPDKKFDLAESRQRFVDHRGRRAARTVSLADIRLTDADFDAADAKRNIY